MPSPKSVSLDSSKMPEFPLESMESPSTPIVYTDVNVVPEHDNEGLEHTISSPQVEISELRSKHRTLDRQRREALNKLLDIKGSIRVFCRVRSSLSIDKRKVQSPVSTKEEKITIRLVGGCRKEFGADRVFSQEATQEDVFREVEPILRSALDGHNVCILAYGQTGTGKTFTMEGTSDQPGIVSRSIEKLFHQASQDNSASFAFSMSMLEVYMGSIRDLLARKQPSSTSMHSLPKCGLNILSSSNGSVEVEGLTDVAISDFKQAHKWYAKGKRARATSWTNVNEASSRSHCLTRITIWRSRETEEGNAAVARLWMVDLGGSERLRKTGATGQTLDEGKAINLSLSALSDVIASIKKKRNHIPYRNSKLTQILSDSLGDGSKVLMIVHISASEDDVGETVCSLSFAKRVRAIEATKELSEELKNGKQKRISELSREIVDAEVQLKKVRNQMERFEKLIQEQKKNFPKEGSPIIKDHEEVVDSPQTAEKFRGKARRNSAPHFMASTASSRQRLSTTQEVNARLRTLRLANKSPIEFVGSQSLSHFDIKPNPWRSNSKSASCEVKTSSCDVKDPKSSSMSRNKKVSTSHPHLRVTPQEV